MVLPLKKSHLSEQVAYLHLLPWFPGKEKIHRLSEAKQLQYIISNASRTYKVAMKNQQSIKKVIQTTAYTTC